jgi:hypothetical protein
MIDDVGETNVLSFSGGLCWLISGLAPFLNTRSSGIDIDESVHCESISILAVRNGRMDPYQIIKGKDVTRILLNFIIKPRV